MSLALLKLINHEFKLLDALLGFHGLDDGSVIHQDRRLPRAVGPSNLPRLNLRQTSACSDATSPAVWRRDGLFRVVLIMSYSPKWPLFHYFWHGDERLVTLKTSVLTMPCGGSIAGSAKGSTLLPSGMWVDPLS